METLKRRRGVAGLLICAWVVAAIAAAPALADPATGSLSQVRQAMAKGKSVESVAGPRAQRPGDVAGASLGAVRSYVAGQALYTTRSGQVRVARSRSGESVSRLIRRLAEDRDVQAAQPNWRYRWSFNPNDPFFVSQDFPNQGYFGFIGLPFAWDNSLGAGVVIADLDSGVQVDHPDLQGQLLEGYNVVTGDPEAGTPGTTDNVGHGTATSGVLVATTNNGIGVAGTAPQARVTQIKSGDLSGPTTFDTVEALDAAVTRGAQVINMSFGGPGQDPVLSQKLADVYNDGRGPVLIASAGESQTGGPGDSSADYPAADLSGQGIGLAVTAIGPDGSRAYWADYGSYVSVGAPGESIVSTVPERESSEGTIGDPSGYSVVNGTSFAGPMTAGLAALLLAAKPTMKASRVLNIIQFTADSESKNGGRGKNVGWGVVNAQKAMAELTTKPTVKGLRYVRVKRKHRAWLRFKATDPNSYFVKAKVRVRRLPHGKYRKVDTDYFYSGRRSRVKWKAPKHRGSYRYRVKAITWGGKSARKTKRIRVR